jgi:hypothetical protein
MLSGDEWTKLLGADPGGWSLTDVKRVLAGLGWHIRPDLADIDVAMPRPCNSLEVVTHGSAAVAVNLQGGDTQGPWFGECVGIEVRHSYPADEIDAAAISTIAEVAAVLGPPTLVGGPDARARWRLTATIVEVTRKRNLGEVSLSVLPRDATENLYVQNAVYGEDLDPKGWQVRPVSRQSATALAGMMSCPPPAARTLDGLEGNLYQVLSSVAEDIGVLQPYVPDIHWAIQTLEEKRRFVVGWFDASACHFGTHETMAATAQDSGQPSGLRIDAPFGRSAGKRIADLAIAEIRSWGIDGPADLEGGAWCEQPSGEVMSFELGLAPESNNAEDDEYDG